MKRNFRNLKKGPFDLLVIGGGIYGAWVSYDASLRGLKVAIVEKNDWASETSQASSKLIHGGLRYLEQFNFSLVKKALTERKRLMKIAPHRVHPIKFVIPVYKKRRLDRFRLKCGLYLYDILGGNRSAPFTHKYLSKEKLLTKYPFLVKKGLKGGFSYMDCATDDAHFTLEIIAGAYKAGAIAVNHAPAIKLLKKNGKINGALVKDNEGGEQIEVNAKVVLNASGPFTSHLGKVEDILKKKVLFSKGTHLIMPPLATKDALLFTTNSDGRVFFCIPWYDKTLLGTTDTFFGDTPESLSVSNGDIEYMLKEVNCFLEYPWNKSEIQAAFAGIRVLKKDSSNSPSSISRDWGLLNPIEGLFFSMGGKFSTAREDADNILQAILKYLQRPMANSITKTKPFPWCPENNYQEWKEKMVNEGYRLGLSKEIATSSVLRYGTSVDLVYSIIRENNLLKNPILQGLPFCQAEIYHSVKNEMARNLEDILRRRIPISILNKPNREILSLTAQIAAELLNWSTEKKEKEIIEYEQKNSLS